MPFIRFPTLQSLLMSAALFLSMGCVSAEIGPIESDPSTENFGKDVEGVYQIETWTQNESACDTNGADLLSTEAEKKLGIRRDFLITPFLVISTCKDPGDCGNATDDSILAEMYGATILHAKTSSGYAFSSDGGRIKSSTSATGCSGLLWEPVLTSSADGRVEFHKTTRRFEEVPFDTKNDEGEDDCSDAKLRQAAQAGSCAVEVISAVREGDLPPKP